MAALSSSSTQNLMSTPESLHDPVSDESRSESVCQKDRSLQETWVPHEEREFPVSPLATGNWGTSRTASPVSSRHGSCDLSIDADHWLENVQPMTSLSESTGTEDDHLRKIETDAADSTERKINNEHVEVAPHTPDAVNTATTSDALDELTRLWTESFGTEVKLSKKRHPSSLSKIPRNLTKPKTTSTQSLNLERARHLSGSKSSIDSERSVSRCQSALGRGQSKLSSKTRSTPDVSKIPPCAQSKTTAQRGKVDYSHVKSKVRQYKEEIDALSRWPKAPSPSRPNYRIAPANTPPRTSAADQSIPGADESLAETIPNFPSQASDLQLLPVLENPVESGKHSSTTDRPEFDAIDALMNSLWDKLEIANKEKRHYKDQYELLDRENAKLRNNVQRLVQAYAGQTCTACSEKGDDVRSKKVKSRPSSSTSTSGWITSSASSHPATLDEEFDDDPQSTAYHRLPSPATPPSDEASTQTLQDSLNVPHSPAHKKNNATSGPSSVPDEINILSSDRVNVNDKLNLTNDEEELEKAAAILFGNSISPTILSLVTGGISATNKTNAPDISEEQYGGDASKACRADSRQADDSSSQDYANISSQVQASLGLRHSVVVPPRQNAAVQTADEQETVKVERRQKLDSTKSAQSDANSAMNVQLPPPKNATRRRNKRKSTPANKNEDLQDLTEFLEVVDMLSGSLATESKALVLAMMKEVHFPESSCSKF